MLQDQLATIGKAENEFEDEIGRERRVDSTIIECRAKNKSQQPGWLIAQFSSQGVIVAKFKKSVTLLFFKKRDFCSSKKGAKKGAKKRGRLVTIESMNEKP